VVNGGHFLIGSGKGHTITQAAGLVAERIALRTGRRAPVTHVTPGRPLSPIEERNFVANITRFTRETGWVPRTNLAEGIDRTVDFFLSEKGARG
jgi:nucleoside-diphosphate-sugar epimerase